MKRESDLPLCEGQNNYANHQHHAPTVIQLVGFELTSIENVSSLKSQNPPKLPSEFDSR